MATEVGERKCSRLAAKKMEKEAEEREEQKSNGKAAAAAASSKKAATKKSTPASKAKAKPAAKPTKKAPAAKTKSTATTTKKRGAAKVEESSENEGDDDEVESEQDGEDDAIVEAPVASSDDKKESSNASSSASKKKQKTVHASSDAAEPTSSSSVASTGGTLKVGDALPAVTLQNEQGESLDVSTLKSVVIFTYPKANTPGCTTQACNYRDDYEEFKKASYAIFGLSNDAPKSLKSWKEKKEFQYHLLSDPKRQLIGALTGKTDKTTRSHFVIDNKGKLALSNVGVKPAESSTSALEFTQTAA